VGNKTSWTGDTEVYVNAGYDGQNGIDASAVTSYKYTQKPYWISLKTVSPTQPTSTVTITLETNATNVPVSLHAGSVGGTQVGDSQSMNHGSGKAFALGTVTTARTIYIVNDVTGAEIGTFTHAATTTNLYTVTSTTACSTGKGINLSSLMGGVTLYINNSIARSISSTYIIQTGNYKISTTQAGLVLSTIPAATATTYLCKR
jgi:hypothetical protein